MPNGIMYGNVTDPIPGPAPHAHPEGYAALRIVPVTVPRASRACEHFPDRFDLHLLPRVQEV